MFLPANRSFSLDCFFGICQRKYYCSSWMINCIKLQIGIVYLYAGISKLNYHWLFEAEPLINWLKHLSDFPIIGQLFMFDSTASINLENENISDVQCFSSCKGLGGITGAAFIAYNVNKVDDRNLPFTFDISTYENKLFTGPYHAICSLEYSVKNLDKIRLNVKKQKEIFIEKYN